jgi:hypothetical protein
METAEAGAEAGVVKGAPFAMRVVETAEVEAEAGVALGHLDKAEAGAGDRLRYLSSLVKRLSPITCLRPEMEVSAGREGMAAWEEPEDYQGRAPIPASGKLAPAGTAAKAVTAVPQVQVPAGRADQV